ncbi:MAG: sel1 repeat family protein, partial [Anaerolineae bacterium]|nr:sel1 repeat family protein [Anaerolineae bacterium]
DMERAEREAEAGNLGAARAELTKLAEFGLADAQVELGDLYSDEDSDEAFRKALHWYQAAAEQGSDRALSRLGKLYAR